jgi:multidrug efflux pump subunit AcrB
MVSGNDNLTRGAARATLMNRKLLLYSVIGALALLAALTVGGFFLGWWLLGKMRDQAVASQRLPTVTVEANYPGANAQVVADTVAAPIEQQINGVEGMLAMYSQSTNDGGYVLTITFPPETDMDIAQVLVQNRVALAEPILPDAVKLNGVAVRKRAPAMLGFVVLSSPDGRFDAHYLGNYATLHIKDELARVAGVADVVLLGQRGSALRIWLDPEKLAIRNLTVNDVTKVLAEQKVQIAAEPIGQPRADGGQVFPMSAIPVGNLRDVESLGKLVLKTGKDGQVVRLADVANLELGSTGQGHASFNGKPVVALGIALLPRAKPREVHGTLQEKLKMLRTKLPEGLDLALAFDFAANLESPNRGDNPEYLRLDLTLPDAASLMRTQTVAAHAEQILRRTAAVGDVLTLSDRPFTLGTNEASLLVSLTPASTRTANRQQLIDQLRPQLAQEIPEALAQMCDVTNAERFPKGGIVLELALTDLADSGLEELRKWGDSLVERLSARPELIAVHLSAGSRLSPQLGIVVDRAQANDRGVALKDIVETLQTCLGELQVNDFNRFGRTWQIQIAGAGDGRLDADKVKQLKVRNSAGEMVPLGDMVKIQAWSGPVVVERFNLRRVVGLTAHPAAGVSLTEAYSVCETVFAEVSQASPGPKAFALEPMRPTPPRGLLPWSSRP